MSYTVRKRKLVRFSSEHTLNFGYSNTDSLEIEKMNRFLQELDTTLYFIFGIGVLMLVLKLFIQAVRVKWMAMIIFVAVYIFKSWSASVIFTGTSYSLFYSRREKELLLCPNVIEIDPERLRYSEFVLMRTEEVLKYRNDEMWACVLNSRKLSRLRMQSETKHNDTKFWTDLENFH